MAEFLQDLRFSLRNLRRTPAFPIAAIATLALGIGATTSIFSTVNAALLRPLPYPAPGDLYSLRTNLTDGRVTTGLLSPVEILHLKDPSLSIMQVAGFQPQQITFIRPDGTPVHMLASTVSEGFFEMFGLPMTLGVGSTHDQVTTNGPPVVVISQRLWRDAFGSDPAVVGKPIRFAEVNATVAGVAPKDFDIPHGADAWVTIGLNPQGVNHSFEAYARVKPGTSIERLRSEAGQVMDAVAKEFPTSSRGRVYIVRPMVDAMVGDLGPILVVVLSATALLLALACVNVTNLLLSRGATRAREIAVRVALGAGRGRIVRQLLTESLLLASAGAVAGLAVAYGGVQLLMVIGAQKLPRLETVPFDGRVLAFALGTLVVSGLVVGFAPALRLARTDVKTLMNENTRSTAGGRAAGRWMSAMTAAQIALAVILVAGAGWLTQSFGRLRTVDPGFASDGRLVFDVAYNGPKFRGQDSVAAANRDLMDRLRGLGGVVGVGGSTNVPLRPGPENSVLVTLQGEVIDPAHLKNSRQRTATPGFFAAMGTQLVTGRDFAETDRQGSQLVAIVNRAFARKHLAGLDPINVRFAWGYPTIDPKNEFAVIGIVDDVRQKSLAEAGEPAFYTSTTQGQPGRLSMVVHTASAPSTTMLNAIRDEIRKTDPAMAVDFETETEIMKATLGRQELGMTLMLLFGATAVLLAAVGIYGVIAYASSQRRGEVATRLALGATPSQVFWLMLSQGRTLTFVGVVLGLAGAYAGGRLVSSQLYAVSASDPVILSAAAVLVVVIATLATVIPAFRAARLNPSRVLNR